MPISKELKRTNIKKHIVFFAVAFALFSIDVALQFVPLISDFSYEYSALNAILFFLLLPVYFGKIMRRENSSFFQILLKNKKELAILFLLPILPPLIFGNACKCSIIHGLQYYLAIPTFTFVYVLIFSYLFANYSTTKYYGSIYSLLLLFTAIPFLEIFVRPQIYFYNPVIGYFPGTVYDKFIPVDGKLILYRIFYVALLGAFFFIRKKKNLLTKILIVLTLFELQIKIPFGYSTTFNSLEAKAENFVINKDFNIYFYDKTEPKTLEYYAFLHSYYKHEIEKTLRDTFDFRINSFVFANNEQKRVLFGAPNADVSKPWQSSVFTVENSGTLKHELIHAYSAKYGKGLLKLAGDFNPFLIEGFAVAVQNEFYGKNIFDVAAQLYQKDKNLLPEQTDNPLQFFKSAPTVGYLFAGAFIKFVINAYGIDKFKKYYLTNDFEISYNKQFQDVYNNFKKFLSNYKLTYRNPALTAYILESKQLYKQICPHYVAEQERRAQRYSDTEKEQIYRKLFEEYHAPKDFFNLLQLYSDKKNFGKGYKLITEYNDYFQNSGYRLKFLQYQIIFEIALNKLSQAEKTNLMLRQSTPFIYFELIFEYYDYLIENYLSFTKEYLSADKEEKKRIIKQKLAESFSPILFLMHLKDFSIDEINEYAAKYEKNFSWLENFYLTKYYIRNLDGIRAEHFVEKIDANQHPKYAFEIENLAEMCDFLLNYNEKPTPQ